MTSPEFPLRHWARTGPVAIMLWPISLIYRVLTGLRRKFYEFGLLRAERVSVPVIVVGNLIVGGTGKTPLVIALVHALVSAGYRPGVVSRGYPGTEPGPRGVQPQDSPSEVGDEALVLVMRCPCPVWIGRARVAAARALLLAHPEVDILICDDGLQHYALARDIEIAVEDARGAGNGLLLPAGPLREPLARRVDFRVANGVARAGAVRMDIVATGFFRVSGSRDAISRDLLRGRIHALAGIGDPRRFFHTLRSLGIDAEEHPFADHHAFGPEDLDFAGADWVLMTEKDAVKCFRFARASDVYLRVDAVLDPGFFSSLTGNLRELTDGPPPA